MSIDLGFTHVALAASDLEESIDFYARYAVMRVVHRRRDPDGSGVVWLSDGTRPFVIVLVGQRGARPSLQGTAHLGVACESRAEVDRRCALARAEGLDVLGPSEAGAPVGYWAMIADPDGNNLELSHGQEVALAVDHTGDA